jgi:ankyrin repeat protein
VAEYLLEHGGDLKKPNASGEYFAHYLARRICKIRNPQGCGVQELQFLINHSIPLDTLNENGDSALHLICATNIKDCDLAHANGLETAVSYFSTIVKMIFGSLTPQGRQALLFKENAEGLTPLHLSIRNGPELLPVLQEVNGLSAYLSTLSTKDHATKNPFILAIQGPVETFQGLAQWYETELKIHMKIISRAASHRKDILAILEKYQEK